jgi:TolA-binding protein
VTHCLSRSRLVAFALVVASTWTLQGRLFAQGTSADEEDAKAIYRNAMGLMLGGSYKEAAQRLEAVRAKYGNTSVGDDALYQLAKYYFERGKDIKKAQELAKQLVESQGRKNGVPGGYLLRGRMALAGGLDPDSVRSALAEFGSVIELFANDYEARAEALYRIGQTYRLSGRPDRAIEYYSTACSDHSQSLWCARSRLGLAASLVRTGQWRLAIEELQRVRTGFPGEPEAAQAIAWNTILYRLYLLPSWQRPAFKFVSSQAPTGQMRDVVSMAADPSGRLLVAFKTGVRVIDARGTTPAVFPAGACLGLFLDQQGEAYEIQSGRLLPEHGDSIPVSVMKSGKPKPIEDIAAAAVFSSGEFLIADPDQGAIHLFSSSGKHLQWWKPSVRASRLAVNELDEVAVLEQTDKSITVLRRIDAGIAIRVPPTGPGYVLRNPVDIVFDALGHLYVLDRDSGTVVVFAPFRQTATPVLVFSIPEKSPGAFQRARAFSVDRFGRLAIFDDRADRIQDYR